MAAVDGGLWRNAVAGLRGLDRDGRAMGEGTVDDLCCGRQRESGDTRLDRIEAFRDLILAAATAELDVNLNQLIDMLRRG